MKKISRKIKYITLSAVFIFALCLIPIKQASAVFVYSSHDILYTVLGGNIPPVADPGANQAISLPTTNTQLNGTGSYDPDGTITNYLWTKTLGSGNITTPSSAITGITGLTSGTSTFCLYVEDNGTPALGNTKCMNVVVSTASNIPPTADAGADQNIIVPANSTSVSGSGFDQDGVIVSYTWSQLSGPTPATITNPNVAGTTITGMTTIGVYVFNLRVYDNDGAFGDDNMTIIVSTTAPPNLTANLWANPNLFPFGGGTTNLTWSSNGTSCTSSDFATGNLPINLSSPVASAVTITKTYRIRCTDGMGNFVNAPATVTVNTKSGPINGACSVPARHFQCAAGSSPTGSQTGGSTGPWTWYCDGIAGGAPSPQCRESVGGGGGGGGDPQCSDGVDNDDPEDTLSDISDPGCWTDKNDPGTYDPNDDNERNSPKIKEIEI